MLEFLIVFMFCDDIKDMLCFDGRHKYSKECYVSK